ncbi:MAG: hypothetical protein GF330_05800 [Candidatus Eisenbacteria bacterium]|nr:hypothetical protein [Candidatus Eisenbacteria bacterium]
MLDWLLILVFCTAGLGLLFGPRRLGVRLRFRGSTLLGFLLLSLGMTAPLIVRLDRLMLESGMGADAYIGIWNLWWTKTAILSGKNPFFTDWLFAPQGTSLALHTHSVTYGLLGLPLQLVLGPSGGDGLYPVYNLIVLLSFCLSGYFAYRCALALSGHREAAILAGIFFAFANFRFANTVRLHVLATEWLAFFLWRWIVLLRCPSPRRLLWLLAGGLLLLYSSLEYATYALLAAVLIGLIEGVRRLRARGAMEPPASAAPRAPRRDWLLAGAACVAGGLILLWPFLVQLAARLRQGGMAFDSRLAVHFSADLLDFLLPNPRHPLWGDLTHRITAGFHSGDGGFGLSMGIVALVLFLMAALRCFRHREGRGWVLLTGLFALLTLGPRLHLAGDVHPIPLPQGWLAEVPLLGTSRTPIRYAAPALFCCALVLAIGLSRVRTRTAGGSRSPGDETAGSQSARRRRWLAIASALLLFELLAAPWPMTAREIPPVYGALGDRPAAQPPAALLHLPGLPAREALLYQTAHHRPTVADVSAAIPLRSPGVAPTLAQIPRWRTLTLALAGRRLSDLRPAERAAVLDELRGALRQRGIGWVVVLGDPRAQHAGSGGRLPRELLGARVYRHYLQNLQLLQPCDVRELSGDALLRF